MWNCNRNSAYPTWQRDFIFLTYTLALRLHIQTNYTWNLEPFNMFHLLVIAAISSLLSLLGHESNELHLKSSILSNLCNLISACLCYMNYQVKKSLIMFRQKKTLSVHFIFFFFFGKFDTSTNMLVTTCIYLQHP